ncbi:hypothetical protein SAMN05216188_13063 [Lentzea xinjiangensis]|uniref:Uncharacterized protein n=1 Tax=Lentzea xinjiangensis TaxID=402600 RepID=A0A1H9W4C4_9PSEU|nr:hypothetical protein SAMN05216188_13063 [Lentzea xinjiangensis]
MLVNEQLVAALAEAEEPFRTLVDDSGWVHASVEGLVLDLGRWWDAGSDLRLDQQSAYSVAASEAARTEGGVYVEGYLWRDGQAAPAAWCGVGEKVVYGPRADAYLGVPLSPRFCRRVQQRNGTAPVLMSRHPNLLPLLTRGLPPGAVLAGGRLGPRHR